MKHIACLCILCCLYKISTSTYLQSNSTSSMADAGAEPLPISNEEALKLCQEPTPETKDFSFEETDFPIKDPRKTLPFYSRILGMRLLQKLDDPATKTSQYYMGYASLDEIEGELGSADRSEWAFSRPSIVELTHNWGTENDAELQLHPEKSDPREYIGRIEITVPDLKAACDRFETLEVNFVKRPEEGRFKDVAFITDPDGYWIEISIDHDE